MRTSLNKIPLAYKPKPLPKGLIYNPKKSTLYRLLETKTGNIIGEMDAIVIKNKDLLYSNNEKSDKIFHIQTLYINNQYRKKGWGKYFIDFAKNESENKKCDGRVALIAYDIDVSPHAFYKKMGFITKDERTNNILDAFIQNNLTPSHWDAMEMYLPQANKNNLKPRKNSYITKFTNLIKKFFNSLSFSM